MLTEKRASPAFIVRGKGNSEALNSCSHGAGRLMSRTAALQTLDPSEVVADLKEKDVEVISGQLDEAPAAYKDINEVIAAQRDLVDVVGRFMPCMVRMAPVEGRKDKQKAYSICSSW